MAIKAITFDFWRTLYRDSLTEERRQVRVEALINLTGTSRETATQVMEDTLREFLRVHVEEQRTLLPHDALPMVEQALGLRFDKDTAETLAEVFATAILQFPPEPIPGALEAVRAAAEKLPVGLISDTGISPGASLEQLLERHGFRDHFTVLSFSDVIGVSKPQPAMYHHAAHSLNVRPDELLHIGDLEPTDIKGALGVRARAALFGGDNRRFVGATSAHHTYESWEEFIEDLPKVLR